MSIFGQPANTPLFGTPKPATPSPFGTPSTGSSLFGAQQQPSQTPGSLFGAQQQQPQTSAASSGGGLFGNNGGLLGAATTSTPAAGGLFGAPATSAPPATGFFGAPASASAATPTTSSSGFFGAATATNAPASGGSLSGAASTGSGLFSTPATATPATGAAPAGGLFGNSTTTPTTGAAPAGGLFGNSTTTPATGAAPAGGLFGNSTATPAPAVTNAGGLFGNSATSAAAAPAAGTATVGGLFGISATTAPAATTAQTTAGVFGSTAPAAPTTGGGLFGSGATQQPPSLFSGASASGTAAAAPKPAGLLWSSTAIPQQNLIPAGTIDPSRLMPTTRFGDCNPDVQRVLEAIEREVQEQLRIATELRARSSAHSKTIDSIPFDCLALEQKLTTTKAFLKDDEEALNVAKLNHLEDDKAAALSIRNADLFRPPTAAQRNQYYLSHHLQQMREVDVTSNKPMINYFNAHVVDMESKLKVFLDTLNEVEHSLRSVELQATSTADGPVAEDMTILTGGVGGRQDARRLNRTLREFNDALKDVSGRIVDVKDDLRRLKAKG